MLSLTLRKWFLNIMAIIYLNRAELMLEWEDSSMAASFCAKALDICRKIEDHLGEADAYRLLGRAFTQRRQWTTATQLFQDSLRLNEEHKNPLDLAETHRDMGKMYVARGHKAKARASLEAALAGFQKLGAKADVAEAERLIESLGKG
ncbi:MAG: tetratricopeptide repeat protein [Candidatus Latescibacteria bacterium]|nr:tetratricopeptide repeat protein [Candidatus Latescibacterota bacterium]